MPIGVNVIACPNPEVGFVLRNNGPEWLRKLVAVTGTKGDYLQGLVEVIGKLRTEFRDRQ
jgi:hypothetical protein